MRVRLDQWAWFPAIIGGLLFGFIWWQQIQLRFPSWRYQGLAVGLSGKIISFDSSKKNIELLANSVFPDSPAAPMNIAYNDATVWSSTTYVFDQGVLVNQHKKPEIARSLPAGTLVWVLFNPNETGPLHITSINFLRRNDL